MKRIPIVIACALSMSASCVYAAGEKGGTEDMPIGVGELQATPEQNPVSNPEALRASPGTAQPGGSEELKNKEDEETTGLILPAIQKARIPGGLKPKGNPETNWKVEQGEK